MKFEKEIGKYKELICMLLRKITENIHVYFPQEASLMKFLPRNSGYVGFNTCSLWPLHLAAP